ncbi:hypothetical protein M3Y94_00444600 [Aphelenchoides besseyi]|nr:hypothetical protein M3Y94_00444600 [Aphelenchoides besseyi]
MSDAIKNLLLELHDNNNQVNAYVSEFKDPTVSQLKNEIESSWFIPLKHQEILCGSVHIHDIKLQDGSGGSASAISNYLSTATLNHKDFAHQSFWDLPHSVELEGRVMNPAAKSSTLEIADMSVVVVWCEDYGWESHVPAERLSIWSRLLPLTPSGAVRGVMSFPQTIDGVRKILWAGSKGKQNKMLVK